MIEHTADVLALSRWLSPETFHAKSETGWRPISPIPASVEFWMVRRATQRIDPEQLGSFWPQWASDSNAGETCQPCRVRWE